jgi:hypothetical protein
MTRKKIIILWHNGGRLANQLWLYISLYAYCLEKNIVLKNPSFFEYSRYFNIPGTNRFISIINIIIPTKILRIIYRLLIKIIALTNQKKLIKTEKLIEVPPTTAEYPEIFKKLEKGQIDQLYTSGWLFRNPAGIKKYHSKICQYFSPKKRYLNKIEKFLGPIRLQSKKIIGVHIRQGDYKKINDAKFTYYNEAEVNSRLLKYLGINQENKNEICFVIVSDGKINLNLFDSSLNIKHHRGNLITDLFLLAKTDLIICSNSSFSLFAAYYGNIKAILFSELPLKIS